MNLKYYLLLGLSVLILCIVIMNYTILDKQTDVSHQIVDVDYVFKYLTKQKRIELLENMYDDIEKRRLSIDEHPDAILGNDHHLITNAYYQTQIMIFNELQNQTE